MNTHDPREINYHPATRTELDLTKPLKTTTGNPARLIGTRNHPMYPIVVAIPDKDGIEYETRCVTKKGEHLAGRDCELDILN